MANGFKSRLIWGGAFVALAAFVAVADVGATLTLWEWMPTQLHSALTSGIAVTVVVLGVHRYVGPASEAYRLGLSAGERRQRERCAANCGKHEDEQRHLHVVAAAVGDDSGEIGLAVRYLPSRPRNASHRAGPRNTRLR